MPQNRGKTRNLTFASQKINKAISSLEGKAFTAKEISEATGVNRHEVSVFLLLKHKKGFLEREKRGHYRNTSNRTLTERSPSAFVANKVWEIISQSDKPLTNREIADIIAKDTEQNTYKSVGTLLFIWFRRSVLDKIGAKRPYRYQVKPDYKDKDRPLVVRRISD